MRLRDPRRWLLAPSSSSWPGASPHWPQLRGPGRFIGVGAGDTGGPRRGEARRQAGVCQNMSSGQVDILYDGGILKLAQLRLLFNSIRLIQHSSLFDYQFSIRTHFMC